MAPLYLYMTGYFSKRLGKLLFPHLARDQRKNRWNHNDGDASLRQTLIVWSALIGKSAERLLRLAGTSSRTIWLKQMGRSIARWHIGC
jgi:hypothetical protein